MKDFLRFLFIVESLIVWNNIYSSEQKDQNDCSNERKSSKTSFMEAIKPLHFQKKILDSMGNEMGNRFSEQTIYSQFLTQLTKPNL